jgi:hypothetical protein
MVDLHAADSSASDPAVIKEGAMDNPQYGMGGEIGGDPVTGVLSLIVMTMIFVLAMLCARQWAAKAPSRSARPDDRFPPDSDLP